MVNGIRGLYITCSLNLRKTAREPKCRPVAPEILIWVLFDPVGALERAGMADSHGRHAGVVRCPPAMLKSFARIGAGPVQREGHCQINWV